MPKEISKSDYTINVVLDKNNIRNSGTLRLKSITNEISVVINSTQNIKDGDYITLKPNGFKFISGTISAIADGKSVEIGRIETTNRGVDLVDIQLNNSDKSSSEYNPIFKTIKYDNLGLRDVEQRIIFKDLSSYSKVVSTIVQKNTIRSIITPYAGKTKLTVSNASNDLLASIDYDAEYSSPVNNPNYNSMYLINYGIEQDSSLSSVAINYSFISSIQKGTKLIYEFSNDNDYNNNLILLRSTSQDTIDGKTVYTSDKSFGSMYTNEYIDPDTRLYTCKLRSIKYSVEEKTNNRLVIVIEEDISETIPNIMLGTHYVTPNVLNETTIDEVNNRTKLPLKYKVKMISPTGATMDDQSKEIYGYINVLSSDGVISIFNYLLTYRYTGDVPTGVVAPNSVRLRYNETINFPSVQDIKQNNKIYHLSWDKSVTSMPRNNHEVVGTWNSTLDTHVLTYEYTGDVPSNVTPPDKKNKSTGDTIEYPTIQPVKQNGKLYKLSWNDSVKTMPENDLTVTGTWSSEDISYTLSYKYTGDIPTGAVAPSSRKVRVNSSIDFPEVTPVAKNGRTYTLTWDKSITVMPYRDLVVIGTWKSVIVPRDKPNNKLSDDNTMFIRAITTGKVNEWYGVGAIKGSRYLNIPGEYDISSNDTYDYFGSVNPGHKLWDDIISRRITVSGDRLHTYVSYTIANSIGLSMTYHNVVIREQREDLVGSTSKPYRLMYTKWIPGIYIGNKEYPLGPEDLNHDATTQHLLDRIKQLENTLDHMIKQFVKSGLWDPSNGLIKDGETTDDYNINARNSLHGGIRPEINVAYGNINLFGGVLDGNYFIRTNNGSTENDLGGILDD